MPGRLGITKDISTEQKTWQVYNFAPEQAFLITHCVEIVILNAMCLWPCWWRMNKLKRLGAFAIFPLWSLDISWLCCMIMWNTFTTLSEQHPNTRHPERGKWGLSASTCIGFAILVLDEVIIPGILLWHLQGGVHRLVCQVQKQGLKMKHAPSSSKAFNTDWMRNNNKNGSSLHFELHLVTKSHNKWEMRICGAVHLQKTMPSMLFLLV